MSTNMVHCTKCGHQNPSTNAACTKCGNFLVSAPSSPMQKPTKVKTLAILILIDGIVNIIWGLLALVSLFAMNFYACLQVPITIPLGIMEIIYASKLLSNPAKPVHPAKHIAVMQIVNVVSLNMLGLFVGSLILGIVSLIFYNDAEVIAFFNNIQAKKRNR